MPSTLTVYGSDLRWRRVYVPKTRKVIHQDLDVEGGTYRVRYKNQHHRVTWIARKGDDTQEGIDLGEYPTRRQVDKRVLEHIDTGT